MKIVYFVHCFPPAVGGLEFLSGEIVKILRSAKHDVTVVTGKGTTLDSYKTFNNWVNETTDPTHIHRLALNTFWQRIANKFLNKLIFVNGSFSPWYFGPILNYSSDIDEIVSKADLIIGAGMPTKMFVDATKYAKRYQKKLLLLPAYHDVNYYNRSLDFQKSFNYSKGVIYLTPQERNLLVGNYKIEPSKLQQLTYNPYSREEMRRGINKIQNFFKKKHRGEIVTIGYVGQISTRKNFSEIVDFLDLYYKKLLDKNIQIKVKLYGVKTNSSPDVERMFSTSGHEDYLNQGIVKIKYNFTNKHQVYSSFDIFVNPSIEESLGIVNFEAIRYGKPLVVHSKSPFIGLFSNSRSSAGPPTISDLYSILTKQYRWRVTELFFDKDKYSKELNQYIANL